MSLISYLMSLILNLMYLINQGDCFNIDTIKYRKDFSENKMNFFDKIIIHKKNHRNKKSLIFFTGGFSFIRSDIYSNFYNNLLDKNITIYTPYFMFNEKEKLTDYIFLNHEEVIVAGHSSGCSCAIDFCVNNSKINKLILLDPVDTFITNNYLNLSFIDTIFFILAGKTYNFSKESPSIPFIPFLGYRSLIQKLNNNIKILKKKNFGHSDILNIFWSNLMHRTRISVGSVNRSENNLYNYHNFLSSRINDFYDL